MLSNVSQKVVVTEMPTITGTFTPSGTQNVKITGHSSALFSPVSFNVYASRDGTDYRSCETLSCDFTESQMKEFLLGYALNLVYYLGDTNRNSLVHIRWLKIGVSSRVISQLHCLWDGTTHKLVCTYTTDLPSEIVMA